jgi:hypothetical protein
MVGFIFEDENEDDEEDDLVINHPQRQTILKIWQIAGS